MRIKNIVLHGFKSFADKEVIYFNKGISCIVGPNGSGKSNLLDAVKWIMGEQNIKELRGGNLDDIIFNGSKNREPSNIAMVTLTLTDIDESISEKWGLFSEVSITRKYYRTGEREYLLNNKSRRLKDIKEFFYDIGISHKSIILIEQGKVDKIVQANPEELREIFEEFAGIINYKDKKREAQKKLEQTTFNLERIKDIYLEVEENKKSFEIQLNELEKYKKLISDKKHIQKTVFSINYKNIIDAICKIDVEKNNLNERKRIVEAEYNNVVELFNEKSSKLNALKKEYDAIKERTYLIKNEIEKNRNLKNITEEKLGLYKDEISKINEKLNVLIRTIDNKKEKQKLLEVKITRLHEEFVNIKNNKDILDATQKELNKKIHLYKEKQKNIDKNIYSLMDGMKRLDQSSYEKNVYIKNILKEQERLIVEKGQIKAEIDEYTKKINDVVFKEKEINEKLTILKESLNKNQYSLDQIKKTLDSENTKLNKANSNKSNTENKIILLKNLIEQIIVGDSKEYKKFIDKYPHTNLIDKIELKNTAEAISYGSIIVFDDEVKNDLLSLFDSNYWPINFIFAEELEIFLNKIKTIPANTVKKNLIHNGLYYVGKRTNDNRENLLVYKNDLKDLGRKKDIINEEINNIKSNIENLHNDFNTKKRLLDSDLAQINRITILLEKLNNERNYCEKEINKLLTRSAIIIKEEKRLCDELEKYQSSLDRDKNEKESISKKLVDLENDSNVIRGDLKEINKKYVNNTEALTALTIKYSELNKEIELLEIAYNEDKINLSNLERERIDLENKLRKYKDIIYTSEKMLCELDVKINELKSNSESTNKHNNILKQEIEELDKTVNAFNIKINKLSTDIKEIEAKYNKHLINEAKLISSKDNLTSQYMQLYNANIDEEYSDCYADVNLNKLNDELLKIDEEISSLGPINMGAEVEYKKLDERSIFLKNQIKDLESSVEKISEMIYNFDKESINRFNETFHQVKENFKKVVKTLFNGGTSDIKIINDSNILESGIEIYIQPPGKKLQNLSLLSGGEKALISCALLFAFFLYRKAPFCFLDEIDAPLDDANIGRFLNIVKTLSVDTQFFIISHNYNTILESDNIYGITMKEPGVSGIYSLRKEDLMAANK